VNQQPAAAKVLGTLLDKLHSASARGRRGNLALVNSMTTSSPAQRPMGRTIFEAVVIAPTRLERARQPRGYRLGGVPNEGFNQPRLGTSD
jgi:hypothetical protein